MLSLRLTDEEEARLRSAAAAGRERLTTWARRTLLRAAGATSREVDQAELERREHRRENAGKARAGKARRRAATEQLPPA